MAASIKGNKITLGTGDSIELNCPIKQIRFAGGVPINIAIDGVPFYFSNAYVYDFPSLHGYPGRLLSVIGEISTPSSVVITKIGDALNLKYFKEDIRNWNGQGAVAVSEASEAQKKAVRAKKAEVTE